VAILQVLESHRLKGLRIDAKRNGLTALDMAEERTDVTEEWLEAWKALIESIMENDQDPDDAPMLDDKHEKNGHVDDGVDSNEDGNEVFEDASENFE